MYILSTDNTQDACMNLWNLHRFEMHAIIKEASYITSIEAISLCVGIGLHEPNILYNYVLWIRFIVCISDFERVFHTGVEQKTIQLV